MAVPEGISDYMSKLALGKDGGPAHPFEAGKDKVVWTGISVRDLFAMHLLPSLIHDARSAADHQYLDIKLVQMCVADAYTVAEAMVTHRRKLYEDEHKVPPTA